MSKETLWGLWSEGKGWVMDSDGLPLAYRSLRIAGDCRDAIQVQRQGETVIVREVRILPAQKTLWGLCVVADGKRAWVMMAHNGLPIFSHERRVILGHISAKRRGDDRLPWFACAVGDDGFPVEPAVSELARALDEDAAVAPVVTAQSEAVVRDMALKEDAEWKKLPDGVPWWSNEGEAARRFFAPEENADIRGTT